MRNFVNRGRFSVGCGDCSRAPIIALGDGKGGGGDGGFDAETLGEGAGEGGLAGADVADEFEAEREFLSFQKSAEVFGKSGEGLLGLENHEEIITLFWVL